MARNLKSWFMDKLVYPALNAVRSATMAPKIQKPANVMDVSDGSNIWLKYDEKRLVQVVSVGKLPEGEEETYYFDLSDGDLVVRAKVTPTCEQHYEQRHRRPVTQGALGSIVVLQQYRLRLNWLVDISREKFNVYIDEFEIRGCEGEQTFGKPVDLHRADEFATLLTCLERYRAHTLRTSRPSLTQPLAQKRKSAAEDKSTTPSKRTKPSDMVDDLPDGSALKKMFYLPQSLRAPNLPVPKLDDLVSQKETTVASSLSPETSQKSLSRSPSPAPPTSKTPFPSPTIRAESPAGQDKAHTSISIAPDDEQTLTTTSNLDEVSLDTHNATIPAEQQKVLEEAQATSWIPAPAGTRSQMLSVPAGVLADVVESRGEAHTTPDDAGSVVSAKEGASASHVMPTGVYQPANPMNFRNSTQYKYDIDTSDESSDESSDDSSDEKSSKRRLGAASSQKTYYADTQDWPPSSPVQEPATRQLPPDSDDEEFASGPPRSSPPIAGVEAVASPESVGREASGDYDDKEPVASPPYSPALSTDHEDPAAPGSIGAEARVDGDEGGKALAGAERRLTTESSPPATTSEQDRRKDPGDACDDEKPHTPKLVTDGIDLAATFPSRLFDTPPHLRRKEQIEVPASLNKEEGRLSSERAKTKSKKRARVHFDSDELEIPSQNGPDPGPAAKVAKLEFLGETARHREEIGLKVSEDEDEIVQREADAHGVARSEEQTHASECGNGDNGLAGTDEQEGDAAPPRDYFDDDTEHGQEEATDLPLSQLPSGGDDSIIPPEFMKFRRAYPRYQGNVKQFLSLVNRLIDSVDWREYTWEIDPKFWDDYVILYEQYDYYVQGHIDKGESFLSYHEFYLQFNYDPNVEPRYNHWVVDIKHIARLHSCRYPAYSWRSLDRDRADRRERAISKRDQWRLKVAKEELDSKVHDLEVERDALQRAIYGRCGDLRDEERANEGPIDTEANQQTATIDQADPDEAREEAGEEAGEVVGEEAGEEAGGEAGEEAGEAGEEAGGEAGEEAGGEAREVAGQEAGEVAGQEAGEVAGQEAGEVAGQEAGEVAGQEAGEVAGQEAGEVAGREAGQEAEKEAGGKAKQAKTWTKEDWEESEQVLAAAKTAIAASRRSTSPLATPPPAYSNDGRRTSPSGSVRKPRAASPPPGWSRKMQKAGKDIFKSFARSKGH